MKCLYCGAEFVPNKKGRPPKYCSDDCCRSADKENKRINYVGKREKFCIQCGCELPKYKTRFCSVRCGRIFRGEIQNHGELTKNCLVCGKEFKTFKSQKKTCSSKCSKILHWRIGDNYHIVVDKDISLEKIAQRDGNICQICNKMVDWNDKKVVNGTVICGDDYPSIDHIIPKSKGGVHSWSNVQLAHRRCNTNKRDK